MPGVTRLYGLLEEAATGPFVLVELQPADTPTGYGFECSWGGIEDDDVPVVLAELLAAMTGADVDKVLEATGHERE
jgi:hypothetical protein